MKTVIVDAVGEPCPVPVVKATKALRELGEPGTLEVRVDNERTRKRLEEEPEENGAVTPFQAFASFYEAVRHCPMTEEQETILARMVEEAEEEERV